MKIIVDENIEYGAEAFSKLGEVELYHGRKISNEILKDADVLITRSITNVNRHLLQNTNVRFVGTATIGTDHIDIPYLKNAGIKFSNAAGCNSQAVTEYVFTALTQLAVENEFNLGEKSIGIIGVGNIGRKVEKFAKSLGMKTFLNDPPREAEEGKLDFCNIEQALSADIVTLHVPLIKGGEYNTHHLINSNNIDLIKENTILINACRGSVVDNHVLYERIVNKQDLKVVLDVWENEPNIFMDLLEVVDIATPHIAGYTLEGKVNGTEMIYNYLKEYLGSDKKWKPNLPQISNRIIEIKNEMSLTEKLYNIFHHIYPIMEDNIELKKMNNVSPNQRGTYFDSLRKNYRLRREMSNYIYDKSLLNF